MPSHCQVEMTAGFISQAKPPITVIASAGRLQGTSSNRARVHGGTRENGCAVSAGCVSLAPREHWRDRSNLGARLGS